ncbi:MAG: NAD-dependent epimerase/dehydratase family protein [Hyphomonadaceae bacterium]|nr:NAD-dependent epimerase/dehydratase family protein [Hyphomonadaceae bacterium]
MRVVVTGAGGFLGRRLLPLLSAHEIVAMDRSLGPSREHAALAIEGDLGDPACVRAAFATRCDALIHLATIPGGASEVDPRLAKAVNIDASMALLDAAIGAGDAPRVIYASSIAVFDHPLAPLVDDATPLAPRMLYGAHKAMMEQWVETLTRRGAISGWSLRFAGLVARPADGVGVKSAYLSNLFHAMRARRAISLPVGAEATSWLMSVDVAAQAVAHALTLDAPPRSLTLPALRVRMADLVAEIASQTGADPRIVSFDPDPDIERTFGRYPELRTPAAEAVGFVHDGSLRELVRRVLATIEKEPSV